jgi:hypothetical protein
MRRGVAWLAIAVGVALVAFPLAYSMFGRTGDAEQILDRFTFLTLGDNPERYLAEAEVTRDGSSQLVDEALPGLAAGAGIGEAEFDALAASRFPALESARVEIAEAEDFSIRYSEQLEAVEDKFQSVYDIPVAGLPLTATPWLFLIAGAACLLAGGVALRSGSRGPIIAILALGVAMLLGPVALGAPWKATDGEDVKDFASRGLTQQAADAAQQASAALDDVYLETREETLPYLAEAAGSSPAQLERELARDYPDAGEFMTEWEVIGPRLSRLADAVSASVEEFDEVEVMPIALPVWLLLAAGAALAVGAGMALARERP